jgi:hypothetical protein
MSEPALDINFYNDWINILRDELIQLGYTIKLTTSDETIEIQFFNVQKRRIHPTPRTIYQAKDLTVPKGYKENFEELLQKIELGTDVNPHLSRNMKKPGFTDEMLNDWGIYHFHLGISTDSDGYQTRTNPLLYAWVTNEAVYAITVESHGAWADKELLNKILENWPELLFSYRLSGVDSVYEYDSTDISEFRKSGVMSPVKLSDNNIYIPPGGGYASDCARTSSEVVEAMDKFRRRIWDFEDSMCTIFPDLLEKLKEDGKSLPAKLQYRLVIAQDNYFYAVEETVKQSVKLAPIDFHSH